MLNSNERMDYICGYLAAYENKIKMANKQGLFDAAKMFELFAANVCSLWFGQVFSNLNTDTATYPYVDLISEDQALFVQVSTAQDAASKVKSTLEKVRDSKDSRVSQVKSIMFFMLHNQSIDKIPDYTDDKVIGSIPFTKKDNLISTQDVLAKAQVDFDFQLKLYNLLRADDLNTSGNEANFIAALGNSQNVGLQNINCCFNGEYQIDRTSLITKVKTDNYRFITIQGSAGSGKSAFCKILLEKEPMVLYARAERFIEESNINNIWSLDIEKVLSYLNGKRIVFFIDALEFIADCRQTKFELLQQLYTVAQKYENTYIVTTCRSSEKGAFIKLDTKLGIHSYVIDDLSDVELTPIAEKYPVIKNMLSNKAYRSLLRIPFYINLILEKDISPDNVLDEIAFREFIWTNVICLKDSAKNYQIKHNEVADTVRSIVFERAKQNLLGVQSDKIDSKIIKALISEGIIVEQRGLLRLKHDTFEDICFEQFFDAKFHECRGNYHTFYREIESFGKCVYRRYQIWISNKLFGSEDRSKFLHRLIFTDAIPADWKKQTEIGIIKSNYCHTFLIEQGQNLVDHNRIWDFVDITNLFGFDVKIQFIPNSEPILDFYPIGNGRAALIQIIYEHKLYIKFNAEQAKITKLCQDYAKQHNRNKDSGPSACAIATYYVDKALKSCLPHDYYHFAEYAGPSLTVIYQMPSACIEWIHSFWHKLSEFYTGTDEKKIRIAEDTIEWTMENAYPQLVSSFPKELCTLFELFWMHPKYSQNIYQGHLEDEVQYGLNEHAEHYNHKFRTVMSNPFFWNLFTGNFLEGFNWAISFVNRCIDAFSQSSHEQITKIQLYFTETKQPKVYWGNPQMWLACIDEHYLPTLISDIIYILNHVVIKNISAYLESNNIGVNFANWIKKKLYAEANNIALLTIVENIGLHFKHNLPGFALDLATSPLLVSWDVHRYSRYLKDPTLELLKRQMLLTAGIPNLENRYEKDAACACTLQDYVFSLQFESDEMLKQRCHQILDYLYATVDDDDANTLLQIQKMDARNAVSEIITESIVAYKPHITGKAEQYMEQHKQSTAEKSELLSKANACIAQAEAGNLCISDMIMLIDKLITSSEILSRDPSNEHILYLLIAATLKSPELGCEKRSVFCELWINGIRRLFLNGSFVVEPKLCLILFQQIHNNVSPEVKNKIKLLILDLLLYYGDNGLVSQIARYAKSFLATEEKLSYALLNTIVKLSEDEMLHQKYNADYLKNHSGEAVPEFIPNLSPSLLNIDRRIRNEGKIEVFKNHRDEIINKYLFEETMLEIEKINIQNHYLPTLCRASNCGVKISDPFFNSLIRNIISSMIDVWHFYKNKYESHKILGYNITSEIMELYRSQMVHSSIDAECAIDSLFEGIDFSKFTDETIEFYENLFGDFLPEFIDTWKSSELRRSCIKKIRYLEQKVNCIKDEYVRRKLSKSLFLSITTYTSVDFSRCQTSYSYEDICFLNEQFSKYGKYHLREMLRTIHQLHTDKLLPDILISISECFNQAKIDSKHFPSTISKERRIILSIIYKAFVNFSNEIKCDDQLTLAFESILETLIELNYENAAVILDEFRLH